MSAGSCRACSQLLTAAVTPPPQAIAIFDSCPALGITPNSHIYSALIAACSAAGRAPEALAYFDAARAAGAANEITYSAAIVACTRANDLDGGMALLREMDAGGMRPDGITYCTLLSAIQRCAGACMGACMGGLWGVAQCLPCVQLHGGACAYEGCMAAHGDAHGPHEVCGSSREQGARCCAWGTLGS